MDKSETFKLRKNGSAKEHACLNLFVVAIGNRVHNFPLYQVTTRAICRLTRTVNKMTVLWKVSFEYSLQKIGFNQLLALLKHEMTTLFISFFAV